MTDDAAEARRPATPDGAPPGRPEPNPAPQPAPVPPATDAPGADPGPDERTVPLVSAGPAPDAEPVDAPPPAPGPPGAGGPPSTAPPPTWAGGPPPPGQGPPPWGYGPSAGPAPGAFTSRYGLVRPRQGRYLAGVCAAIGRATNTDPVLWRVLLAVLGFFGGIGILIYVAAWLIIPAEGDTASPVESMLGRGRSSMSPVTVLVLGILVAVMFGLIVTDGFRAVLLGAAILIGGALLLNRNGTGRSPDPVTGSGPYAPPGQPGPGWPTVPAPSGEQSGYAPGGAVPYPAGPTAGDRPGAPLGTGYPAGGPVTRTAPETYPAYGGAPVGGEPSGGPAEQSYPGGAPTPITGFPASTGGADPAAGDLPTAQFPAGGGLPAPAAFPVASRYPPAAPYPGAAPVGPPPPDRGYRPAFSPRGPYAGTGAIPAGPNPPRVKPPKPPRERSPLGAATFSLIFVAIGAVTILDLTHAVPVTPSGYFAAALVTIALGLLVGAWFGRARWLIALGLAAAAALGISTLTESYNGSVDSHQGTVNWSPAGYDQLADRYENSFGDATLDLRHVDFTGHDAKVTVQVKFGTLKVIVPPSVDVTTTANVTAGDAHVFSNEWSNVDGQGRQVVDLGADGAGGGKLRLNVRVDAGNVEVTR